MKNRRAFQNNILRVRASGFARTARGWHDELLRRRKSFTAAADEVVLGRKLRICNYKFLGRCSRSDKVICAGSFD